MQCSVQRWDVRSFVSMITLKIATSVHMKYASSGHITQLKVHTSNLMFSEEYFTRKRYPFCNYQNRWTLKRGNEEHKRLWKHTPATLEVGWQLSLFSDSVSSLTLGYGLGNRIPTMRCRNTWKQGKHELKSKITVTCKQAVIVSHIYV